RLYQLLPAVYRERDNGDLSAYLDACGTLLDAIQQTLDQRLADNFPDTPPAGLTCQDWLLPYFGKLLDVRLVSPEAVGRRAEIAKAVAWRQAKGTLAVAEQIAEAVGDMEVEIAEGWQRVATMARIGIPLLPAGNFGVTPEPDRHISSEAARHPALPAGTVDFRYASRAVNHPVACLGGHDWVQGNPHGVPCVIGGFDDATRRTVDLRTPGWDHGHHHPRTLLLFAPPPAGFFDINMESIKWSDRAKPQYQHLIAIEETPTFYRIRKLGGTRIRFTGPVTLDGHKDYVIEGFSFSTTVNCVHGNLFLRDVAAPKVMAQRHGAEIPALTARDCLFRDVTTARGLMRLEYCTVLRKTICEWLEASDCIFIGTVQKDHPTRPPPRDGCVRVSRLPGLALGAVRVHQCSDDEPIFFNQIFGKQGCAALHPASSQAIRHGAEDGGEMGCYHDRHYVLRAEAVIDKLKDYLPLGLEAVLVYDKRLLCPIPIVK
ncbi:MAG: hypothetical protein Q8J76_01070, partial [Desulfobulbaceae bacterium]|nr:hypothetical protein [Desulfobulbaceae bacterium]